ncbi:MAG TPA: hypothetical protein VJZ27_06075 [Aggregatilineales bacterium]|nr:hypothetical protein [Aggregatilineales bacterium]
MSPGNTVEIRHQGRMLIYTLTDFSRPAGIDAYYDRAIADVQKRLEDESILAVHDVSAMPLTWTPQIRRRADELIQIGRTLKSGRVALIFRDSVFLRLTRTFIEWQQRRYFPHIATQIFFSRDEGIAWVESGLTDRQISNTDYNW